MAASTSAVAASISLARRRVAREVSLGQAHAADVDRARCLDVVGAAHELRRPPAEVDDEVGAGHAEGRQTAGRTGEGEGRLLLAAHDLGRDVSAEVLVEGGAHAVDELRGVARVAGGRGGHEADPLGAQLTARHGILPRDAQRALHRLGGDRPGAVDAVAEPHDLHAALEVDERAGRRVDVGDEQADRVGAAVDRADADGLVSHGRPRRQRVSGGCRACHGGVLRPRGRAAHDVGVHQSSSIASASSPSGLTPGPAASECADEDVQALDPGRHATRRHPVDLGHLTELGAAREVLLVGRAVGRRELGVLGRAARSSRA